MNFFLGGGRHTSKISGRLWEPCGRSEIKPGLALFKANVLPAMLLLWPREMNLKKSKYLFRFQIY